MVAEEWLVLKVNKIEVICPRQLRIEVPLKDITINFIEKKIYIKCYKCRVIHSINLEKK